MAFLGRLSAGLEPGRRRQTAFGGLGVFAAGFGLHPKRLRRLPASALYKLQNVFPAGDLQPLPQQPQQLGLCHFPQGTAADLLGQHHRQLLASRFLSLHR